MNREIEQKTPRESPAPRSPIAPAFERAPGTLSHLLTPLGRYVAPALAAIALVVVIAGEPAELDEDLHLIVADEAVPGRALPMRARLYTGLRAIEGPSLRAQRVEVELLTHAGQRVAQTRLEPAAAQLHDCQGELQLPAQLGRFRIIARAVVGERTLRTSKALHLVAALPERQPEGRELRALQQFAAGPVQSEPGQIAPDSLRVQVRAGACVPEQPCEALVHIGEPAASLRVDGNATVTPSARARAASALSSGVVSLQFVTHGPEAELWLIAERSGQRVARRAVRLPIAMAAVSVQLDALVTLPDALPRLRAFGADDGCIVDVFARGAWLHSASRARCEAAQVLPFPALSPGIVRVQVRRDSFSAQSAGVALLFVRTPAQSARDVASELARAAAVLDGDDPVVRSCLAASCEPEPATLAYLAAELEAGVFEPPTAVSGYADRLSSLRERQARLRALSLAALALGGLSLALSIGHKGLGAGARARQLLQNEDGSAEFARRAQLRSVALVVASVLSILMVFAVIGLYVLVRGGY